MSNYQSAPAFLVRSEPAAGRRVPDRRLLTGRSHRIPGEVVVASPDFQPTAYASHRDNEGAQKLIALRHAVEYHILRGTLAAFDRLSFGGARRLATVLAQMWWWVDYRRRRVAQSNILRCGIESDPRRARALAHRSVHHMGLVAIESLRSSEILDDDRWREHVRMEIAPDVLEVLEDPDRGLIMASGHFGNWEIAAQLLSRYKPVAGITRKMNNPRVEDLVQRRKPRYRFHPIPKYAADPRRFMTVLESGEILALLTDQYAHSRGMDVEFFGHPASTHTTAAMLHLVTKAPLCFASCRRTAPMRFELTTSPLIEHPPSGKKKQDVYAILSTINRHLEAVIRQAPEQYVWGHRRWRDLST